MLFQQHVEDELTRCCFGSHKMDFSTLPFCWKVAACMFKQLSPDAIEHLTSHADQAPSILLTKPLAMHGARFSLMCRGGVLVPARSFCTALGPIAARPGPTTRMGSASDGPSTAPAKGSYLRCGSHQHWPRGDACGGHWSAERPLPVPGTDAVRLGRRIPALLT